LSDLLRVLYVMSRTVESDRVRAVARRFGRSWPAADASWRRKVRTARQVLVILAAPAKECLDRGGILKSDGT